MFLQPGLTLLPMGEIRKGVILLQTLLTGFWERPVFMARIADAEIERLRSEVSLVRLIESAGVKLTRRGKDELLGCCPFHEDGTPSLSVSVAKNLFHCF